MRCVDCNIDKTITVVQVVPVYRNKTREVHVCRPCIAKREAPIEHPPIVRRGGQR